MTDSSLPPWEISLPLRTFLTLTACPPAWRSYNLYLIHDEKVALYAGQSYCAFDRLWEHIKGGPHGHSIVGRFLLVNWPRSGRFTITLFNSLGPRFAAAGPSLDSAERLLIEQLTPCFNVSLNAQPSPLPPEFLPPNAPIKYLKNLRRMIREAGYAARKELLDGE